jgi:hypothetical protein
MPHMAWHRTWAIRLFGLSKLGRCGAAVSVERRIDGSGRLGAAGIPPDATPGSGPLVIMLSIDRFLDSHAECSRMRCPASQVGDSMP